MRGRSVRAGLIRGREPTSAQPPPDRSGLSGPGPENIAPPAISGVAASGVTLSAGTGVWVSGAGSLHYTYQWQRCALVCADIPTATRTTYRLTRADVNCSIVVVVTATDDLGVAMTIASAQTGVVLG